MTISFIFRERPDAEPVKISGKPGNIVKNAHRNKKKAVKTTFPKGFSSSGNKHFRRYFPRGAQKNSHDDRLHGSEVRSSPCMKTVVMTTKTVVTGKGCRPP